MKTLYLVRHAKSSWENPEVGDVERPLNDRGKRDAPAMGVRLRKLKVNPDLMITSYAKRARATCTRIAKELGYSEQRIREESRLYHANEGDIISVLRNLDDKYERVMAFGHNPGLTDFVNAFSTEEEVTDNIPTCGVVAFEIPLNTWSAIEFGTGKLLFYDYPKRDFRSSSE